MATSNPLGGDVVGLREVPFPRWQVAAAVAAVLVLLISAFLPAPRGLTSPPDGAVKMPDTWEQRQAAATGIAKAAAGTVSFVVLDQSGHTVASHNASNMVSAASTLKALILVAYLRQSGVADRDLKPSEVASMTGMITASSNADASSLLNDVGWAAMGDVASAAGMADQFTPDTSQWGLTQVTAGAMGSFFYEMPTLIPARHRAFALGLFGKIIPSQQWGMTAATPQGWQWHVKAGWISEVVNQIGTFTSDGRELTVAVTVEGAPGTGSNVSGGNPKSVPAVRTIAAVTHALLADGTVPGAAGEDPCGAQQPGAQAASEPVHVGWAEVACGG